MNTQPKPPFEISAKYLGPVFSLDGRLTKKAQNLIFARNGTGKSFLSRAFRYLDIHRLGGALDDAARNLVSDESPDGKGLFCFSRGSEVMGTLSLEKSGDRVTTQISDTIFHVFSGDFVQEELRERKYCLDGQIENEIAIDSANIQLQDMHRALEQAQIAERDASRNLQLKFDSEKASELINKAGVRRQLREYAALRFESALSKFTAKPSAPRQAFADVLRDLDQLKAIPSEPTYPQSVDFLNVDSVDIMSLTASLMRPTSPSSVSEDIKQRIESHHVFYEAGVAIVLDENRDRCPFCEQGVSSADPKAIIDAYVSYFANEEEKHKSELRTHHSTIKQVEIKLAERKTALDRQRSQYDSLKRYLPSMRDSELADAGSVLQEIGDTLARVRGTIEKKASKLGTARTLSEEDKTLRITDLNAVIEENNVKVEKMSMAIAKSDHERRDLQRDACLVFEQEFVIRHWASIEALFTLQQEAKSKGDELTTLEKSAPSSNARSRVADTFELLLREFFGTKYVFDKNAFTLRRGDHEMKRGPHRTLSDGEKTAIAFCYFVACVHRKVTSNSDYHRLFLIFDDPVTSMSYEFVFAIAQTLKNLNMSDQGQISINPGSIDGMKHFRPKLLILTHSSYFFNISLTNKVIDGNAAFALLSEKDQHTIVPLNKYVAPFQSQLRDIYDIAQGGQADHSTGNAIRSVLEAVGRFCRPDKSGSLSEFVQYLAGEEGISVKSVLINSLCHGTYYEETMPPDDLKLACEETLAVVARYAAGQLEILKNPG